MQEIMLNDIDFGSLVSIAQNKQKTDISSVQTQIIRQLVTLNARSKEHGEYLYTIMMMLNDMQEKIKSSAGQSSETSLPNHEFEQIYEILPVSDEESLNNLQQALTNNTIFYNKTVKMLSLIGGGDIKESVRRILRKLISNEFAKT
uniref:Uncharacterized protein n=1 Tax=Schizaphis graminum TaxID=13262 RepID=A0A2S2NAH2_SCHGA